MTCGPNTKHLLLILSLHLTWKMQNLKLHVIFLGELKGQAEALQGSPYLHATRPTVVSQHTADLGWPRVGVAGAQAQDSQQSRIGGHSHPPISPPLELHNLALRTFKGWVPELHFAQPLLFRTHPPHPLYGYWFSILIQNTFAYVWRRGYVCAYMCMFLQNRIMIYTCLCNLLVPT